MGERNSEPRNGAKEFLTAAPLSPRSGALQLTTGTHGSRRGLGCFALRAWCFGCGYAALRGGQSCPQPPSGGSFDRDANLLTLAISSFANVNCVPPVPLLLSHKSHAIFLLDSQQRSA